jgi:hypothetical protein
MKSLIARQLYRPAVVLPLLILMRLMVALDFNLAQVTLVVIVKSSQYVLGVVFRHSVGRVEHVVHEKTCHC